MAILRALLVLLGSLWIAQPAWAFHTALIFSTEPQSKKEILSFDIPSLKSKPEVSLQGPEHLRIVLPGFVSLPFGSGKKETKQHYINSSVYFKDFNLETIPGGRPGLILNVILKQPLLFFRSHIEKQKSGKQRFRLSVGAYPQDKIESATKLIEGRILAGQDATLVIISYTGNGWIDGLDSRGSQAASRMPLVDYGNRIIRLNWPGARIAPDWKPTEEGRTGELIQARGLVKEALIHQFPNNQVSMEFAIHPWVEQTHFYPSPQAGLFIIELRSREGDKKGREKEIKRLLAMRKNSIAQGVPIPLNQLDPFFIPQRENVQIDGEEFNENYFYTQALQAERDLQYAKARGYMSSMIKLFPKSPNVEFATFYKIDLAKKMPSWRPGWLLEELERGLARFPNTVNFPKYRLLQLKQFNRSGIFERAIALVNDPNLPRNNPEVLLEKGWALVGFSRQNSQTARWEEAESFFNQALKMDNNKGVFSALALFHLARASWERRCNRYIHIPPVIWGHMRKPCSLGGAVKKLNQLDPKQIDLLTDYPQWLNEIGDIYFRNRDYRRAFRYYAILLSQYGQDKRYAPHALLMAAEAQRKLGGWRRPQGVALKPTSVGFLEQLLFQFPDSESAIWGRIYMVEQQEHTDALDEKGNRIKVTPQEKLAQLDAIIKDAKSLYATSEAHFSKAQIYAETGDFHSALKSLNTMMLISERETQRNRIRRVKKDYIVQGMKDALENERPEEAVALAEAYGENWHGWPQFDEANLLMGEALIRLGLYERAQAFLKNSKIDPAPELIQLAKAMDLGATAVVVPAKNGIIKISKPAARARLDEAKKLVEKKEWEGVLVMLEKISESILTPKEKDQRLRLMATAEFQRRRYPSAFRLMERLLHEKKVEGGRDFYQYAELLMAWKGGERALPLFEKISKEAKTLEFKGFSLIRMGDIQQKRGDFESAEKNYRLAAQIGGDAAWAKVAEENAAQLKMVSDMGSGNP
ncbi:tetratricopeptide repeat protein [Magnetococcales bacterium HHB-1]